jgi:hypothetical protein
MVGRVLDGGVDEQGIAVIIAWVSVALRITVAT